MFTLPAQAQDCRVFYASDFDGHYCEARLLSRPPAPDYWVLTLAGTLKDSNQRPAANLRCRLTRSAHITELQNKPSSSNYFRWARNTHIAQNVQCGGTWSSKLITFAPVGELMILTLHRIFNTRHRIRKIEDYFTDPAVRDLLSYIRWGPVI